MAADLHVREVISSISGFQSQEFGIFNYHSTLHCNECRTWREKNLTAHHISLQFCQLILQPIEEVTIEPPSGVMHLPCPVSQLAQARAPSSSDITLLERISKFERVDTIAPDVRECTNMLETAW
jgi:hypothetical protein